MCPEQDEPAEQFIYPKNALLKKSLQGIIYAVLEHRRVVFRPDVLSMAILNYNGGIDDSNFDTEKPPGPNYKKAVNILKTFEGKFTKFTNSGIGLEVFIFRKDKRRVKSFAELEELSSLDPDMSEVVATTAKLDLSQKWKDLYVSEVLIVGDIGAADIARMDSAKPLEKDIGEIIAARPDSFKNKHKPRKGSELSPDDLVEIKFSVDNLLSKEEI